MPVPKRTWCGKSSFVQRKTFRTLTGQDGYTILDLQLNADATDADVEAIRTQAGSGTTFSDDRRSNSEAIGRLLFVCIVCLRVSRCNRSDRGFQHCKQHLHERVRAGTAIRRYAGHRYEQPSTDANGSGGGCNLFTVWHSSGLCSWAPSKLVLIPNHGYGQLGNPVVYPMGSTGLDCPIGGILCRTGSSRSLPAYPPHVHR